MKALPLIILLLMGVVFLFSLVNSDPYVSNAEKNAKYILNKAAKIIERKFGQAVHSTTLLVMEQMLLEC